MFVCTSHKTTGLVFIMDGTQNLIDFNHKVKAEVFSHFRGENSAYNESFHHKINIWDMATLYWTE